MASNFNALRGQANTNAWLVDGITDNEYTFNTVMVQPSVESIQELQVRTGIFSAKFEFLRNNDLDARITSTPALPRFSHRIAGTSTAGPSADRS